MNDKGKRRKQNLQTLYMEAREKDVPLQNAHAPIGNISPKVTMCLWHVSQLKKRLRAITLVSVCPRLVHTFGAESDNSLHCRR
jgi:hypothetical protein